MVYVQHIKDLPADFAPISVRLAVGKKFIQRSSVFERLIPTPIGARFVAVLIAPLRPVFISTLFATPAIAQTGL